MEKRRMKKEIEEELKKDVLNTELLKDFYEKNNMDDIVFSSIEQFNDIEVTGGVSIPHPILAEKENGITDLLMQYELDEIEPSVLEKIEVRGLNKEHALVLIKDGMTTDQILEATQALPNISESDQMLMMIKSQVEPSLLEGMEKLGIAVEELQDGKIKVKALSKIAEIDENGKTMLSPKLKNQLAPFEQMGLLSLDEEFAVEMIEPQEKELTQEESEKISYTQNKSSRLKIVPIKEKQKVMDEDEKEKAKIANSLGVKAEDIQSCIRFADREVASQFFNDSVDMNHSAILVRLKNNKFWMMEEDKDGNWTKRKGLEVSKAASTLGDKIKDTHHKGDSWILPGEMVAGKTHEYSNKYDFFELMLPGENKKDGASFAMYVGVSNDDVHEMRIITSRNNNVYELEESRTSPKIPSRVFINSNIGERAEINLDATKEHELSEKKSKGLERFPLSLNEISRIQELKRELVEIEQEIAQLEYNHENDNKNPSIDDEERREDDRNEDIPTYSRENESRKAELTKRRSDILTELGWDEAKVIEKDSDEEELDFMEHTHTRKY